MVEGYGRQLARLLRQHGCTFVRPGKGDHEIWHSPISDCHVVLDRGVRSRFTANAVLRDASIPFRF